MSSRHFSHDFQMPSVLGQIIKHVTCATDVSNLYPRQVQSPIPWTLTKWPKILEGRNFLWVCVRIIYRCRDVLTVKGENTKCSFRCLQDSRSTDTKKKGKWPQIMLYLSSHRLDLSAWRPPLNFGTESETLPAELKNQYWPDSRKILNAVTGLT